jgi:hypothetical protein
MLTENEIIDEYCRGFGAAAPKVKEYFVSVAENTRRR